MAEFLTAAQMRAIEQKAIESDQMAGLELMERAGRGVVEAVFDAWPDLARAPHRAVVMCGPGNNGGDGFVVARLLHDLGWDMDLYFYGTPSKLPPDAKTNYERWRPLGETTPLSDDAIADYAEDHPGTALAIDAIFGIGLSRPFTSLRRVQSELNQWQAASPSGAAPRVVAIDVPSGLNADTGHFDGYQRGAPPDLCAAANLTVTFHAPKPGHFTNFGPRACGKLVVKDIGL